MPPQEGVQAERIRPDSMPPRTVSKHRIREEATGSPLSSVSGVRRAIRCPASLNSGEITSEARSTVTAKDTRVGGTSSFSKDPLMESLPPMEAIPRSIWASKAPSRADRGFPQRAGSRMGFSKYSWKVR